MTHQGESDHNPESEWKVRVALVGLVAALILLGGLLAPDYGQSWDEAIDAQHYEITAKAYIGSLTRHPGGLKRYYGPFYFMISGLLTDALNLVLPGWQKVEVRHWVNYLSFLAGFGAFYGLSRSILKTTSVRLAAALALASQPLLFGHAFINQKDIPFMSFFLISAYLGWRAVDRDIRRGNSQDVSDSRRSTDFGKLLQDVRQAWREKPTRAKAAVLMIAGLTLLLLGELFLWQAIFLPFAEQLVQQAYHGTASAPLQAAFNRMASAAETAPLSYYVDKVQRFYAAARVYVAVGSLALLGFILSRLFRSALEPHLRSWRRRNLSWMVAGIFLGLATAIRVAGPFAGVLVSLYALGRSRRAALRPLIIYWLVAGLTTYIFWPYLWEAPLAHFIESLRAMGAFESHRALYRGVIYPSTDLPWHYFPGLMAVQLTEPAVLLIPLGLCVAVAWAVRKRLDRLQVALLAAWFFLPAVAIAATGAPLYGNARQLYFLLPPLFVFAGLGLEWLLQRIPVRWAQAALVLFILAPGLIGIISLHPYEYSYYNSFAGGISGAFLRYETDHWCTSFREAVETLNQIAPGGATLAVRGPRSAAEPFARPDLHFVSADAHPDYALGCKWAIIEGDFFPEYQTIHEVKRGEAVLAVLKAAP